jgi:hypothetical protein
MYWFWVAGTQQRHARESIHGGAGFIRVVAAIPGALRSLYELQQPYIALQFLSAS